MVTKSTNRDDDQFGGRMDYQISASDSLFGRYTDYDSSLFRPGIGELAGNVFPYSGRNLIVQETHIFSPTLLNIFKFGYNRAECLQQLGKHADKHRKRTRHKDQPGSRGIRTTRA